MSSSPQQPQQQPQPLVEQQSAEQPLRSAKDFENEEALRHALTDMNAPGWTMSYDSLFADPEDQNENSSSNLFHTSSRGGGSMDNLASKDDSNNANANSEDGTTSGDDGPTELNENWDWVLTNYDPETTEPQSVNQELHRLKVLMSYMILDSDREESFDLLTKMASRIFKVKIALISLVDLGRHWFLSNHGLGNIRQASRDGGFCAHAIQGKADVLVVPDASKDSRFCNSPVVVGLPEIRFYAGAPLVSSEGYKLGTFCIIDPKPRPQGLTDLQQKVLKDFAAIAIKTMADRRHLADQEDPSRLVACTAHDLLTPLSGVLLSLSVLKEDEEFDKSLNEHQKECIATASRSSEMMRRICQTTIKTLRKANKGVVVNTNGTTSGEGGSKADGGESEGRPFIDIREFVKSLHMIIDPIPKRVPLVITVDSSVPMHIVSDDLKIFRASLNLLSNACRNTETGSIRFRMYVNNDQLVFECEDSGQDINTDDRERLFHNMDDFGTVADLGLYSLAAQVDSLGGQYGFRPRGEDVDGAAIMDTKGRKATGSVFWFSIPIVVPSDMPRPSSRDGITHLSGIRSVESFASAAASMSSIDTAAAAMSRNNSGLLAVTAAVARSMSGSSNSCLDCLVRTLSAQSSAAFGQNKQPLRGTVNSTWDSKKPSKPMNINILRIRQALGEKDGSRTNATLTAAANAAVKLSSSSLRGLPAKVNALDGAPAPAFSPVMDAFRKKKALVIEDSVVVRKTLARALQKLGYEVSQAVDGMEGLKELKKTVFDLTLCDFLMPNLDGLSCVQQYRQWEEENRPSFRQYIVGISAHASLNDVEKGLEIGMNDFKPKPVTIKNLKELHESTELVQVRATLDELHRISSSSSADMSLKGKKQKMDADAILNSAAELSTASLILQRKRRSRNELSINLNPEDGFDAANRLRKRGKFSSDDLESAGKAEKVCLIASDSHNHESDLTKQMSANGWKVTQVQDGNSVLRMLKTRNWGAVLLDDELPLMSGSRCVAAFRAWELKNRVCRQNNVFLVCSSGLPSPRDATSVVQAPCGFDGALDAPVMWKDVKYLLKRSQIGEPQHRGGLNIVTR